MHIDAEHEPDRARRAYDSHLARARWMSGSGYKQLLRRDWGDDDSDEYSGQGPIDERSDPRH
jgi:hypothetical protein